MVLKLNQICRQVSKWANIFIFLSLTYLFCCHILMLILSSKTLLCLFVWFLDKVLCHTEYSDTNFYSEIVLLCLFEWFLDKTFLSHSAWIFRLSLAWLFMWLLEWSVVVWYLLFTVQILIGILWIICPFCTFSMLHFIVTSSHFFLSFRYFFYKPDWNNQNGNAWSPY